MNWIKKIQRSFSAKLSFYVLFCASVVFLFSFLFSHLFTGRVIRENADHNAENLLALTRYKIENVFMSIISAHDNIRWAVIDRGIVPDSLFGLTRDVVKNNPYIFGSAVAFEPYHFKDRGYYFAPFSSRRDGTIETVGLGADDYDYFSMEWYEAPKRLRAPYWTDPYYDEGGGQVLMTTLSTPLYDTRGTFIGVFTTDVSLEWLTDLVNEVKPYPSSYTVLLGHNGAFLAHPDRDYIMRESVFSLADRLGDDMLREVGLRMTNGEAGMAELGNASGGVRSDIYFAPLPFAGWSLGMVTHVRDVFGEFYRTRAVTAALLFSGLLALFAVCLFVVRKLTGPLKVFSRSAREIARGNFDAELPHIDTQDEMLELSNSFSFMRRELVGYMNELQAAASRKERIESELRIARDIQMGMLPKTFPPFPERGDIDLYALLRPAREVGGDFYDFFIEGDKLYFAVGDVSGKGVPASLFMAVTRSLFRSASALYDDPAQIVHTMNSSISETNDANMFVTLFAGVLNLATGDLCYCNAGHNPPVVMPEGEVPSLMKVSPHIPVGLFGDFCFRTERVALTDGMTLLLYTDGLTEAENRNEEPYRDSRLLHILKECAAHPPRTLIETVVEDVDKHVDGAPRSDDLTVLAIRYNSSDRFDRTLTLRNDLSEIALLSRFVEDTGEALSLPLGLVIKLNLALEEAVNNVISYAYPQGESGEITVVAKCDGDILSFTVTDEGREFDPTQRAEADITSSAAERPIGGLGIHLIKNIMDEVEYCRSEEKNILTLKKNIK